MRKEEYFFYQNAIKHAAGDKNDDRMLNDDDGLDEAVERKNNFILSHNRIRNFVRSKSKVLRLFLRIARLICVSVRENLLE